MTARTWHGVSALGNTFQNLKDHAPTSFFTAAILLSPLLFTSTIVGVTGNPFVAFVNSMVAFVATMWLAFAITLGTKMYSAGEDPGVGGLLDRSGTRRLFSFMGTNLLVGLLIGLVVGVVMLITAGAGIVAVGSPLATGQFQRYERPGLFLFAMLALVVGIILAVVLGLLLYLRYGLAGPVNALEEQTPRKSLTRSKQITEGNRLDFFLLLLMLGGIYLVVSLVVNGPAIILNYRAAGIAGLGSRMQPELLTPAAAVVTAVSSYLAGIIGGVLSTSAITNFYLEIKGEEPAEAPSLPGTAPPPAPGDQAPAQGSSWSWDLTDKS